MVLRKPKHTKHPSSVHHILCNLPNAPIGDLLLLEGIVSICKVPIAYGGPSKAGLGQKGCMRLDDDDNNDDDDGDDDDDDDDGELRATASVACC